jgi:ribosomal protein S21
MTRLNLQQASLMAASGELGEKALRALKERVERDSDALIELERSKARMALLGRLPKPELTPLEKERISSAIKNTVRGKLDERFRTGAREPAQAPAVPALPEDAMKLQQPTRQPRHKRFIYGGLAGLSAAAAVLLIAGTLWSVNRQVEQRRAESIRQAEEKLRDYLATDSENMTDFAIKRFKKQLQAAEVSLTTSDDVPSAAQQLLDHLDAVDPQLNSGISDDMPL